jgi:predicted GNAT family N-acyltransferase
LKLKQNSLCVSTVDAERVRPLRQRVLRPHQRAEELIYPGDVEPQSRHFVATNEAREVIAIASIYRQQHDRHPEIGEWRLRGMASAPEFRGTGAGSAVLLASIAYAAAISPAGLWCNARLAASDFYSHHGFVRVGEIFDIEGIGPHYLMTRLLQAKDAGAAPKLVSSEPDDTLSP